jgi:hypothetical protein
VSQYYSTTNGHQPSFVFLYSAWHISGFKENYAASYNDKRCVFYQSHFCTCECCLCVRTADETEEDGDMKERCPKQRRTEEPEEQHFLTSDRK